MTAFATIFLAAVSPLLTASDYEFVAPRFPALIKGKIMAETRDYGAVRYEDAEFLEEARRERNYLMNGGTPVRATNDNVQADGRITLGLAEPFSGGWIGATTEVTRTVRTVVTGSDRTKTHAAWKVERVSPLTNVTFVTQTMTNGVEDVWTNSYVYASNAVTRVTATNLVTEADFCLADETRGRDETAYERFWKYYHPRVLMTADVVTNAYAHYKGCTRGAPRAADLQGDCLVTRYHKDYLHEEFYGIVYTNGTSETRVTARYTPHYGINGRKSINDAQNVQVAGETYNESSVYTLESHVPTGLVGRVGSAYAFYAADVYTNNGVFARLMIPLGAATATVLANEATVCFRTATLDEKTLLRSAAAAAGLTMRTFGDAANGEHYSQSVGEAYGRPAQFYLQIDFNPETTWQQ